MTNISLENDGYAAYDYAWKTQGWTVQNPTFTAGVDTYTDPGLPADVTKVRLFGTFIEQSTGRPLDGVLVIRTSKRLTYNPTGAVVMPGVKRFRFRYGQFSLLLPATDDPQLTPAFTYEARLTVSGYPINFTFALPSATAEVDVRTLLPA